MDTTNRLAFRIQERVPLNPCRRTCWLRRETLNDGGLGIDDRHSIALMERTELGRVVGGLSTERSDRILLNIGATLETFGGTVPHHDFEAVRTGEDTSLELLFGHLETSRHVPNQPATLGKKH